jgi:hypothetical protein
MIIRNLTDTETRFRETLVEFPFKREAILQTFGPQKEVTSEYDRSYLFVLDDRGEQANFTASPTLN